MRRKALSDLENRITILEGAPRVSFADISRLCARIEELEAAVKAARGEYVGEYVWHPANPYRPPEPKLPDDVVELVRAAREARKWLPDYVRPAKRLDEAFKPFEGRMPEECKRATYDMPNVAFRCGDCGKVV